MATLRDVQLCELDMLREVDRIAEKYNLYYIMAYGTFLGAVRHKGVIPWDDDLDVSMPLADFRKFEKVCKKELNSKYFLQTPNTDVAPFTFYKMRANNTEMVEEWLRGLHMHHGIWIDIFPYVYGAKSQFGRDIQWFCLINLNRIRARYFNKDDRNPIKRILAHMPEWLMKSLDALLLRIIEKLGSKKSGLCFDMNGYLEKEENFTNSDFFEKRRKWEYEGESFYGPEQYDGYLTWCYGKDYMTPVQYEYHTDDIEKVRIDF